MFLTARERVLAASGEATADLGLSRADTIALIVFGTVMALFALWTLLR